MIDLKRPTAALAVALTFSLAACGEQKPARVVDDKPAAVVESEAAEESTEDAAPEVTPVGTKVAVGDWEVKVTKVQLDAGALIHQANEFNDKASGQYVLVTYEATYSGAERTADASDLTWTFTGADQKVITEASQVTPADNEEWPTSARTGGTVRGQALFDVPPAQITGGLLSVEGYDDEYDTVYADFSL